MYSCSFNCSTVPRIRRAVLAQDKNPRVRYRFISPEPSAYISAIANKRAGKLEKTWIRKEITSSTFFPK